MSYEELIDLIETLGLGPFVLTGDNHVKLGCMFQETKHADGYDRRASSTISYGTGESWFKCFACGTQVPMYKAVMMLAPYRLELDIVDISRRIQAAETITGAAPSGIPDRVSPVFNNELKAMLKLGLPESARSFLTSKNIDAAYAVKEFKVCFMPKGFQAPSMPKPAFVDCVYFPLLSWRSGHLVCLGGHARPLESKIKYFSPLPGYYYGSLYGEHRSGAMANQDVFVVEGVLDVIHLAQEGFHALGAMGTGFSGAKASLMASIRPARAIVFMDGDKPGQVGAERVLRGLKAYNVVTVNHVQDRDPKHCTKEELERIRTTAT